MKKNPGEVLKHARMRSGYTQEDLAKSMGYSTSQLVSNWERSVCGIPIKNAVKFCKLTRMKPTDMRALLVAEAKRKIDRRLGIAASSEK